MKSLSYHYTPNHRYERYLDAFAQAPPLVALILDGSLDDYRAVKTRIGDGRILLRSYPWSDGGFDVLHRIAADPVGTGKWMAQHWIELARTWGSDFDKAKTYVTGCNEYTVIPGMPIPPFVQAEQTFMETLAPEGIRACICNLGVGHPAELNGQGGVDWSPFASWVPVLKRTGSILGLHEYWRSEQGPDMGVSDADAARSRYWYAWRFMQCPFDVPIAITECGVDQKVNAPSGTPSEGWQKTLSPQQYAAQLERYYHVAAQDDRFLGGTIFTHDYNSTEWATYDTDRGLPEIVAVAKRSPDLTWYVGGTTPLPPDPDLPTPPVPLPVGNVVLPLPRSAYRISQHWNVDLSDRHEGIDLAALPTVDVLAIADGVVAWVDDNRDDSPRPYKGGYGLYIRIWHPRLACHSFYAHLSKQLVKQGDKVTAGQKVGKVGTTGNSTGNHLHFEIRLCDPAGNYLLSTPLGNGRVDPESELARYGLSFKENAGNG